MSELEQKEKELTFEEICPNWSRRIAGLDEISKGEFFAKIHTDLCSLSRCFVGEAHGFEGFGGCPECGEFSSFYGGLCEPFDGTKVIDNGKFKMDWNKFNERKDAFVKHWNEKHG